MNNNIAALSGVELVALSRKASQVFGDVNLGYLCKINELIHNAFLDYSSIFAFRVDLRFTNPEAGCPDSPTCFQNSDGQVIKRFMASLQSQLDAADESRRKRGVRFHPTKIRYIWAREQTDMVFQHYHLLFVLNKAAYWRLNDYHSAESLAGKIQKAWCSALGLMLTLIHK